MAFPATLPSYTITAGAETANGAAGGLGLSGLLNAFEVDITGIGTKMGSGSSTPAAGKVLRANGTGTSVWGAVDLTADVTGTLPVANGGTGATSSTGSGAVVLTSSPTIVTPTIASFTNAQHDHSNAAGGGQLGTSAYTNATVTADKLATGAVEANNTASTGTTTSTSYTATLTSGGTNPAATATIGANGLALVSIYTFMQQDTSGAVMYMSFAMSGANTAAASDSYVLVFQAPAAIRNSGVGAVFLMTGLAAGSTTFTLNYKVSSGTGSYIARRIAVVPL